MPKVAADSANRKDQIIVGTLRKPKEATMNHVLPSFLIQVC